MCNEPLHKQSATKRFMCMHILNRNVIVAQRTVTKKRFLRQNRCIELGKRYVALHSSARVKQLLPVVVIYLEAIYCCL